MTASRAYLLIFLVLFSGLLHIYAKPPDQNNDIALALTSLKKTYCDGEPALFRYTLTNIGKRKITVDVGDGGIEYLFFSKSDHVLIRNRATIHVLENLVPGAPPQKPLRPGESYSQIVALNAWLTLNPGKNRIESTFRNDTLEVNVKFDVLVSKCDRTDLLSTLREDIRVWSAEFAHDQKKFHVVNAIASAVASESKARRAWKEIISKMKLSVSERDFADSVLTCSENYKNR